jgi:acyl-CoA thioester hydrolase
LSSEISITPAARRITESRIRARYSETDQMGVIYYANYLVWMEVGRTDYCRVVGLNYRDLEERDGILLAVAEANCRYAAPARYDDEVIIATSINAARSRMMQFDYEMRAASDDRMLARGFTKHVFLDRQFRPVKLPDEYLKLLLS